MLSEKENKWRLIHNPIRNKYCFLIGINDFAIELQKEEFFLLFELLNKLISEFNCLKDNLLDEEIVNLEIEISPWYAELEGTKREWSLRIILDSCEESRSFEMYWPIQIAENLFFEMRKMWESLHKENK